MVGGSETLPEVGHPTPTNETSSGWRYFYTTLTGRHEFSTLEFLQFALLVGACYFKARGKPLTSCEVVLNMSHI